MMFKELFLGIWFILVTISSIVSVFAIIECLFKNKEED